MPSSRRLPGLLRPSSPSFYICVPWATFPPAYARQGAPADVQSFGAVTRRAMRPRRPRARRSRSSGPPVIPPRPPSSANSWSADNAEAAAILEPAATRDPGGEAALQLGLLNQQLGRAQVATRLLTQVSGQGSIRQRR